MKKTCRIAAIPGDGIGKEVLPEGIHVLQAAAERWGLSLSFEQMGQLRVLYASRQDDAR